MNISTAWVYKNEVETFSFIFLILKSIQLMTNIGLYYY